MMQLGQRKSKNLDSRLLISGMTNENHKGVSPPYNPDYRGKKDPLSPPKAKNIKSKNPLRKKKRLPTIRGKIPP